MKPFGILICLIFLSFSLEAQTSLEGIWDTGKENTQLEVAPGEDGSLVGVLRSSDNERVEVGTPILKDIAQKGETWVGKLYSLKKEKWYDAVFVLEGDVLSITVKAGMMRKTIVWTKV